LKELQGLYYVTQSWITPPYKESLATLIDKAARLSL